jgi:phosphonate metabolism protein PhnN/1,5-bisphosphokinase (PRPP-forming)
MSKAAGIERDDGSALRGTLALVVGPSGAGKDTLIAAARTVLAGDPRFAFARRVVTRMRDDESESHDVMAPAEFARAEAAGAFLVAWWAHGLGYAIPATAGAALERGQVLVANVSRTVIEAAEARVPSVAVLHVTAPLDVLAARIAARGREPVDAIAARLARKPPLTVGRAELVEIVNDGPLEAAARRFTDALRRLAPRQAQTAR